MKKVINGVMIFLLGVMTGMFGFSALIAWQEAEKPGSISKMYQSYIRG